MYMSYTHIANSIQQKWMVPTIILRGSPPPAARHGLGFWDRRRHGSLLPFGMLAGMAGGPFRWWWWNLQWQWTCLCLAGSSEGQAYTASMHSK